MYSSEIVKELRKCYPPFREPALHMYFVRNGGFMLGVDRGVCT